jgi:hypothetical protein
MSTKDPKFPYAYACQRLQDIVGNSRGKPRISMAEAADIRREFARVLKIPDARLALRLAAEHLRNKED